MVVARQVNDRQHCAALLANTQASYIVLIVNQVVTSGGASAPEPRHGSRARVALRSATWCEVVRVPPDARTVAYVRMEKTEKHEDTKTAQTPPESETLVRGIGSELADWLADRLRENAVDAIPKGRLLPRWNGDAEEWPTWSLRVQEIATRLQASEEL